MGKLRRGNELVILSHGPAGVQPPRFRLGRRWQILVDQSSRSLLSSISSGERSEPEWDPSQLPRINKHMRVTRDLCQRVLCHHKLPRTALLDNFGCPTWSPTEKPFENLLHRSDTAHSESENADAKYPRCRIIVWFTI